MKRITGRTWTAVAAAVAIGAVVVPAAPAQAFTQTWTGAATYRKSNDFIPTSTNISVGGKSCPGKSFYIELRMTRGGTLVWDGPFELADGQWRGEGGVSARTGTAYYMEWRSTLGAPACQGVQAFPTQ
jgi:hypothetical protein